MVNFGSFLVHSILFLLLNSVLKVRMVYYPSIIILIIDHWLSLEIGVSLQGGNVSDYHFMAILPNADHLLCFNMNVNPSCFCGEPETLVHLFTSCPLVCDILVWFTMQHKQYDPSEVLTDGNIIFGFSSASRVPLVFFTLLGILQLHGSFAKNVTIQLINLHTNGIVGSITAEDWICVTCDFIT